MGPGDVLRELGRIAERAGVLVRTEALDPELFGPGSGRRGGLCRLDGTFVLLVDERATIDEKIAVFVDAFRALDLDAVYMLPEIRQRIERARVR